MAKNKRRKVKHYRRSFYSRGMQVRRAVGIGVLVVVVLAAAWGWRRPMCWTGLPIPGIPWCGTGTCPHPPRQ